MSCCGGGKGKRRANAVRAHLRTIGSVFSESFMTGADAADSASNASSGNKEEKERETFRRLVAALVLKKTSGATTASKPVFELKVRLLFSPGRPVFRFEVLFGGKTLTLFSRRTTTRRRCATWSS
jgi:hypothetical protein